MKIKQNYKEGNEIRLKFIETLIPGGRRMRQWGGIFNIDIYSNSLKSFVSGTNQPGKPELV